MIKKIQKENGFTMTELVVTVALIGTLLSFAVPRYTTVTEEMQAERNIANMQTIREVFFHYFYRMHQQKGRISHFPPEPTNENKTMDDSWAETPMDSTLSPIAPNNLFREARSLKIPTIILLNTPLGKILSVLRVRLDII